MSGNSPLDQDGGARRVAFLERYYEITQSLIGVARLGMTAEQRKRTAPWDHQLDVLEVRNLVSLGVPLSKIGPNLMFYAPQAAVDEVAADQSGAA